MNKTRRCPAIVTLLAGTESRNLARRLWSLRVIERLMDLGVSVAD